MMSSIDHKVVQYILHFWVLQGEVLQIFAGIQILHDQSWARVPAVQVENQRDIRTCVCARMHVMQVVIIKKMCMHVMHASYVPIFLRFNIRFCILVIGSTTTRWVGINIFLYDSCTKFITWSNCILAFKSFLFFRWNTIPFFLTQSGESMPASLIDAIQLVIMALVRIVVVSFLYRLVFAITALHPLMRCFVWDRTAKTRAFVDFTNRKFL